MSSVASIACGLPAADLFSIIDLLCFALHCVFVEVTSVAKKTSYKLPPDDGLGGVEAETHIRRMDETNKGEPWAAATQVHKEQ